MLKMSEKQKTINREIKFDGVGVHSGLPSSLVLKPTQVDMGFVIQNQKDSSKKIQVGKVIPEKFSNASVLKVGNFQVSTIEHVLAAINMLGIDNVIMEIDGVEFPILDGSSKPFVDEIVKVGLKEQNAEKKY